MHYEIIEKLGAQKVATALGLTCGAVTQWRHAGIAHRQRARVAALAKAAGIDLPDDFYENDL